MRLGKMCAAAAVLAVGVAGVATTARADVLLDQIDATGFQINFYASQRLESTYQQYNSGVVDDFTVAGGKYHVDSVAAGMAFMNGDSLVSSIPSYAVEIYSSKAAAAGNLTGDVASVSVPGGAASVAGRVVTLDLSTAGVVLDPGTYYLAVIARADFAAYGWQIGVRSSTLGGPDAFMANPAGGYGFPGGFMDLVDLGAGAAAGAAYRLEASPVAAVPLPASAWAGAGLVGLLGVLRTRRRAAATV